MTSSKLIGRETMISRLQAFHSLRIKRVFAGNDSVIAAKLEDFSYAIYSAKSTAKICKEYDETFSTMVERNGRFFWPWEVAA